MKQRVPRIRKPWLNLRCALRQKDSNKREQLRLQTYALQGKLLLVKGRGAPDSLAIRTGRIALVSRYGIQRDYGEIVTENRIFVHTFVILIYYNRNS